MAQKFEVRLVSPKEFTKVAQSNPRYAGVAAQLEDVAGFADPEQRRAYVRNTHWAPLNKYLIDHEFEHLLEEEGTDEDEHGIRYKRGSDIVRNVLPVIASAIIPGFIGASGGLSSILAGASAGAATRAGVSAAQGRRAIGREAVRGAVGGAGTAAGGLASPGAAVAGSQLGDIAGRAVSGMGTGRGVGRQALTAFGTGAATDILLGQGLGTRGGRTVTTSGVTGQRLGAAPSGPTPRALTNISGPPGAGPASRLTTGIRPPPGGGGPGGIGDFQPPGGSLFIKPRGSATQAGQGILSRFTQGAGAVATGLGIAGLGTQAGRAPQVPSFITPRIQNIESQVGKGGFTPVGQLGQTRLSEQLQRPIEEEAKLPPEILDDLRNDFRLQKERVTSQFKLLRPGADVTTDTQFRLAMQEIDRQESATIAQLQLQRRQEVEVQRRQDISTALGIDERELETLVNVAQLEPLQIAAQLGVDMQQANEIKSMFGGLGSLFVASGLGLFA